MIYQLVGIIGLVIEVIGVHYATVRRRGWLLALSGAALWGVYAVGEGQWPAMLSTAIFAVAYARHYWVVSHDMYRSDQDASRG